MSVAEKPEPFLLEARRYNRFHFWVDRRAVLGSSLVCPVRTLWEDFERWHAASFTDGLSPLDAGQFVGALGRLQGVDFRERSEGSRGRLGRCATGVGLLPLKEERFA